MAEPFSLVVNVVQILSACTATIKTIDHLIKQYKDAAKKLESLASEAELVKVTLGQLDHILKGKASFFARKLDNDPDLKSAIDRTLTGCWTVFLLLYKELGKLVPENGKDAGILQKAGLLFNDEIIQDYRSQIRGHVQGLESVLICLQAQTVSETHDILQKASETLERIADATLNIRSQHKEYCFPESIYEGYSTFDEDKKFDHDLLNTPAYRAAFRMARQNSLISGSTSLVEASSQSVKAQKHPSQDFLSDQPVKEQAPTIEDTDLLESEGIGDLISFAEDTHDQTGKPIMSPSAQLMEGLFWGSPPEPAVRHLLDEEVEITEKIVDVPAALQTKAAISMTEEEIVTLQPKALDVKIRNSLAVEGPETTTEEQEERRDLGCPQLNHIPDATSVSPRNSSILPILPTDDKFSIPVLDEKIVVETERGIDGPASSTSSMSRMDSTSTASTGMIPYSTIVHQAELSPHSPHSPGAPSVLSVHSLPAHHRMSETPVYVPLDDEHQEERLLNMMSHCLASPDPDVQLDWAEDALRHCAVNAAHEKRIAEMKVKKRTPARAPLSEKESLLMAGARQIVEDLRVAENGRAYFLNAKYILPQEGKEYEYLLAHGKRYPRAFFCVGEISEKNGAVKEAVKRYRDGANLSDAGCLYRLARAHLDGQLDIKVDKEKGLDFLQKAVRCADNDCPDALHFLAELHLAPPPSKLKAGFKLSSSKPLVQHSVSTAVTQFRRAALLGHGPSQLRLGQVHQYGYFDPKEAKKFARRLSRTGTVRNRRDSSTSTSSAGGADAEVDITLAMHYLHLAARRGIPEADYEIAHDLFSSCDRDRDGVPKQYERLAYAHATRAFLGGVPLAFGLLGKAYEEGIGCKKDLKLAEKYYYDGGKRGDSLARERSDALRNQGVGLDGNTLSYVRGG